MWGEQETVPKLLNGTNFSDLEWPRFQGHDIIQRQITRKWYKIVTMADQYEVAYVLSNGAIFNDLERPLTWFWRSRHSLTLNISQTATDTATVTIDGE